MVKDYFDKDTVGSRVLIAVISSLVIGFLLITYQQKLVNEERENEIIQIDRWNVGIACSIKKVYEEDSAGEFGAQYDTSIYTKNLSLIHNKSRNLGELIHTNRVYMDSSNKMLDLLLEGRGDRDELQLKRFDAANKIIENIKKYNLSLQEVSCGDEEKNQ